MIASTSGFYNGPWPNNNASVKKADNSSFKPSEDCALYVDSSSPKEELGVALKELGRYLNM